jgi:HEAT repeat protein
LIKTTKENEILQLNPEVYENLWIIVDAAKSSLREYQVSLLEKIGRDFPPEFILKKRYPLEEIKQIFNLAICSEDENTIITALCWFPIVDVNEGRLAAQKHIEHSNQNVRAEAICALGWCGNKKDIALLKKLSQRGLIPLLKVEIFISLLRLGYEKALGPCIDLLETTSEREMINLVSGLSTLLGQYDFSSMHSKLENLAGEANSAELREEISDFFLLTNREVANGVISILDGSDIEHQKKLLPFFSHNDKFIRYFALSKLGGGDYPNKNKMPKTTPASRIFKSILCLTRDNNEEVRAEAVSVLGDWKRIEDIECCASMLSDTEEIVRVNSLYALGEIGNVKALPYLFSFEKKITSPLERVRFCQACIRLGERSFFAEWLSFLAHEDATIRSNIAGGVWSIIQPEWQSSILEALEKAMAIETHNNTYQDLKAAIGVTVELGLR